MDAFEQPHEKAKALFDLYGATVRDLAKPVHTVPGNHDVFGVSAKSGVAASILCMGRSSTKTGWARGLVPSTTRVGTSSGWTRCSSRRKRPMKDVWTMSNWRGCSGTWKTGRKAPLVVVTHIPLATAFGTFPFPDLPELRPVLTVTNARQVLALFEGYNLKAVLQGHTHIAERVEHRACSISPPAQSAATGGRVRTMARRKATRC